MQKLTIILFLILVNVTPLSSNIRKKSMFEAKPNFWCQKCPAGKFLEKPCEENRGKPFCQPCPDNKYTPTPNNLTYCLDCKNCDGGQEVVKYCTKFSDTACLCPPGKYYHIFEGRVGFCLHHTVCPLGTKIQVVGTPWNDRVCRPTVTTTTPTSNTNPQRPSTSSPRQTTTDRYMTPSNTSPDPQVNSETESNKHCCNKWYTIAVIEMKSMFEAKPNFWCQKCPAGKFLEKPCEENRGKSSCEACPNNKYTSKPTNLTYCLDCKNCDGGQEVVKICTSMSDTVCQCPPGKYYHIYEGVTGICFHHTVCPEGIQVEGTPWNDTVCTVTMTTPTPNRSPQSPSPTQTTTDRYMTSNTSVTCPDPQVNSETESDKHSDIWFMVAIIEMVIIIVMVMVITGYIIKQHCLIRPFRIVPQTDPDLEMS